MDDNKRLLVGATGLAFKFPILIAIGGLGVFMLCFMVMFLFISAILGGAGFDAKDDPNLVAFAAEYCVYDLDDDYLENVQNIIGVSDRVMDEIFESSVVYKVDMSIVLTLLNSDGITVNKANFERKAKEVSLYYARNMIDIHSIAEHLAPLVIVGYEKDENGNNDRSKPIYDIDTRFITKMVNYYTLLGPSMYCFDNGGGDLSQYVVSGDFSSPVTKPIYVNSPYGYRIHPITGNFSHHNGVDIKCSNPEPLLSVQKGVVVRSQYHNSLGNYVMIDHGNNLFTLYGHLSRLYVRVGDSVQPGSTIGACGSTGDSTGDHLHFEVHINGAWGQTVDPMRYYKFN